jgi:hypothetical protein
VTLNDRASSRASALAEELFGDVLSGRPRDSHVLATKVHLTMSDTDRGLSRDQIHSSSRWLSRADSLRMDYVRLYRCHRYDPRDAAQGGRRQLIRAREDAGAESDAACVQGGLEAALCAASARRTGRSCSRSMYGLWLGRAGNGAPRGWLRGGSSLRAFALAVERGVWHRFPTAAPRRSPQSSSRASSPAPSAGGRGRSSRPAMAPPAGCGPGSLHQRRPLRPTSGVRGERVGETREERLLRAP